MNCKHQSQCAVRIIALLAAVVLFPLSGMLMLPVFTVYVTDICKRKTVNPS